MSGTGRGGPAKTPDLRLAGCAGAIWLTSLVGLETSARVGVFAAVAATIPAVALAAWLARSPGDRPGLGRWGWLVVAILIGVVCGAASTAARVAARDGPPLRELAERRATVQVELTVTDDPRPVRSGLAGVPQSYAVPVRLRSVRAGGPPVRVAVRALVLASDPGWRALLPGTPVSASGRLAPPRGGDLSAAVLSATGPPTAGTAPWLQRAAGALRTGMGEAVGRWLPTWSGRLSPHVMRHYCASHLYEQGMTLKAIQELMGHSWLSTTTQYVHVHSTHIETSWAAANERTLRRLGTPGTKEG